MAARDDSALVQQANQLIVTEDSSPIVLAEKKALLASLDLEKLVQDLIRTGKLIKIAHNGIVGAGPEYVGLQTEVLGIGREIAQICGESVVAVSSFCATADNVLNTLQAMYIYLLDGYEDVAIGLLENLAETAKQMAAEANDLKLKFENEEKKVIAVRDKTMRVEASANSHESDMKDKQEEIEKIKNAHEELIKKYYQLAEEAMEEEKEYEEKEDKELYYSKVMPLGLFAVGIAIAGVLPWAGIFGISKADSFIAAEREASLTRAQKYKETALKKLNIEQEQKKIYIEAIEKNLELTQKIKQCMLEADMARIAKNALHQAAGAFKYLSTVMMQATSFWKYMETHCRKFASLGIKKHIEQAMKMDKSARRKFWESQGFVNVVKQYYARWMAFCSMCTDYKGQLKDTREELLEYIKENPTCKEARERLPELVEDFKNDLDRKKAILQEEVEAVQKERMHLAEQ